MIAKISSTKNEILPKKNTFRNFVPQFFYDNAIFLSQQRAASYQRFLP